MLLEHSRAETALPAVDRGRSEGQLAQRVERVSVQQSCGRVGRGALANGVRSPEVVDERLDDSQDGRLAGAAGAHERELEVARQGFWSRRGRANDGEDDAGAGFKRVGVRKRKVEMLEQGRTRGGQKSMKKGPSNTYQKSLYGSSDGGRGGGRKSRKRK